MKYPENSSRPCKPTQNGEFLSGQSGVFHSELQDLLLIQPVCYFVYLSSHAILAFICLQLTLTPLTPIGK